MRSRFTLLVWAFLVLVAPAQVVINEVYTGTPDFVELRNLGTTPVDVSGWNVETFQSTSGTPASEGSYTLPSGIILAEGDSVVLEENGTAGAVGTLGACAVRTGYNYNWTSTRNVIAILRDSNGVAMDYMYRNASGAAGAPNLPANLLWTGDLTTTGNVIYRNGDVDTDDASDWSVNNTTTPCAENPGQNVPPPPPPPLLLTAVTSGAGDLDLDLVSDPALPGAEFWTVASLIIYDPVGSGPIFGVGLDSLNYFGLPITPGAPFHNNLDGSGAFAFDAPVGTVPPSFRVQLVSVAVRPDFTILPSNVVDVTF